MYLQRFGLRREPFSIAPDPRALFLSERHREALAHLRYGAQGGGGFVLLTGAIGAGKTTVCRAFLEQLPPNIRVAYVFNPQLDSLELLQTVCEEFGIALSTPVPTGAKTYIDALNRFLLERHAAGDHCLLLIDEAQCLAPAVLEQLRLLTNLETNSAKLLQIMLVGQPELRELLARPDLEQLAQRVIARYHLQGLDEAETAAYVLHRLTLAGWQGTPPFDAGALKALHTLSGGVPRRINLLADRTLLALYARGNDRADRALLQGVARELAGEPAQASIPQQRWPLLAAAGLLLAGAAVAGSWWMTRSNPASAERAGVQAGSSAPPSSPTGPPPAPDAPAVLPPGFASSDAALHALAPRWGLEAGALAERPCAPPAGEWRCWTARLSLPALRALDRPGVLQLLDDQGHPQALLLIRLDADSAWLQGAQGGPSRQPLLSLANRWSGDYLTLWRAPPGLRDTALPAAPEPASARWLDAQLDAAGAEPNPSRSVRIGAFQRAEGLQADGRAGPLTLMRLAQRADPREPRLQPPASP